MNTLEAIRTRRSIRSFKTAPVADSIRQLLLEAAMCAPSANNLKPWQFICINDHSILTRITTFHPYANMLKQAPQAITVCGDLRLEKNIQYIALDCAAATQNILLAAHSLGLGAVWIGIYPREERIQKLSELLNLIPDVIPISMIAFGYPNEKKASIQRYDDTRIHMNTW